MEYSEVKEWLDRHVRHFREGNEIDCFNNEITAITYETKIMLSRGIELVADIMGLELMETVREDSEYPYKYSFVYDGVEFIQIEKERMVGTHAVQMSCV